MGRQKRGRRFQTLLLINLLDTCKTIPKSVAKKMTNWKKETIEKKHNFYLNTMINVKFVILFLCFISWCSPYQLLSEKVSHVIEKQGDISAYYLVVSGQSACRVVVVYC